ncbi:hypothetical protein ACP70R_035109 [Stipagrostis hirtigluma subsp. patula]
MAAPSSSMTSEDDYETEQKKQAAVDVLSHYSQFVMVCIGEGIRPTDLRLHLMKTARIQSYIYHPNGTLYSLCGEHKSPGSSDDKPPCNASKEEVSGMPTSLKKESQQAAASPDSSGEPSSSGTMKGDKNEIP